MARAYGWPAMGSVRLRSPLLWTVTPHLWTVAEKGYILIATSTWSNQQQRLAIGLLMSLARDRKFLDLFSLVAGALLGLFVGVMLLASFLASRG